VGLARYSFSMCLLDEHVCRPSEVQRDILALIYYQTESGSISWMLTTESRSISWMLTTESGSISWMLTEYPGDAKEE
jgi:hypothetical protein